MCLCLPSFNIFSASFHQLSEKGCVSSLHVYPSSNSSSPQSQPPPHPTDPPLPGHHYHCLPLPLRNEEHFSFSAPFITPCCESVSKSVYMTDTGSQTLGYFRRLTTSVEICRDVKNTLTSTRSGAPPGRDTEHKKSSFFSWVS